MTSGDTSRKPGVRSLAKATGLSVATISRVLNGSTAVTGATRARVLAAMKDVGYVPNPAARMLATRRSRTIGALVPTLSNSIFARFLNAVEIELASHGYALVVATTDYIDSVETRRAKELLRLGAEALILSGASQEQALLTLLEVADIPAVCSSVSRTDSGLPAIGYDNEQVAVSAINYLVGLGHRKVAVAHGPLEHNDRTRLRLAGVAKAADKAHCQIQHIPVSLSVEGGVEATRVVSQLAEPVSALLCLSDVLALGVLFEAPRHNMTIPGTLSLMGVDDLDWSALANPALTTVRLPTARMGRAIARALVDRLDHDQPVDSIPLKADIIERASTAALALDPGQAHR